MSVSPADLQEAKRVVLEYHRSLDRAEPVALAEVVAKHTTDDYRFRGVDPLGVSSGAEPVAATVWQPLRQAFAPIQRRPDVFLAGANELTEDGEIWVCQMGHLLGLFDRPWLGIPPTGRMCFLRFAEFNRIEGDQIGETALFLDVISVMRQAGHYPLPPATGSHHIHPGPLTNDGVLLDPQDPADGRATLNLVERMIDDLTEANIIAGETGDDRVPASVLAKTWRDDMIWSGPEGIGATYTIDRYQQQHQYPFRLNLGNKQFNGHVARFAEGDYACFFGWPNLTNTATGGFLGLPGSGQPADMRVVDVYRRHGDKLAENWVFIDLVHWLDMQGLDVLARMRQLSGQEEL